MKKIAAAMISIGVLMAFVACSWEIPQTVSVKSKADYSFSLGNFEQELNDEMDITSMLGDLEANPVITPYDYFPGKKDKNTQHFLLEIAVVDQTLLAKDDVEAALSTLPVTDGKVNIGALNLSAGSQEAIGLDFNPSTIFTNMKDVLGGDMKGKITFAEVPMYLYCETVPGLTAVATMRMFYGNKAEPIQEISGTGASVLNNSAVSNTPKPVYEYDGESKVVISDLSTSKTIGGQTVKIQDLINLNSSDVTEEDQLCVECNISSIAGTVSKASIQNGIPFKLYAVIDLPLYFKVNDKDDITMDVNSMTQDSENSTESATNEATSAASSSGDSEFAKYLDAVDTIAIKYIAYKLPFYSSSPSAMKLGIDMVGNGVFEYSKLSVVNKNKTITEDDKGSIELPYSAIEKIKSNASFTPNFQILMTRKSYFSIPREKAIEMNVELNLVTDGVVQVM